MGTKTKGLSVEMAVHLQELGFSCYDDYEAWCWRLGRPAARRKTERERAADLAARFQEHAATKLAEVRRQRRDRDRLIEAAVLGPYRPVGPNRYDGVAHAARSVDGAARRAYVALLKTWDWPLDAGPAVLELDANEANCFEAALACVASYHKRWHRPLESWRCTSSNPLSVFGSLVRHLFARYPLPAFLETAWFGDRRFCEWYVGLGAGESTRGLPAAPLPYTRRMQHLFLEAPEGFTVDGALRRGQVLGMGGSMQLVRALLGTRLARLGPHEEFWATVIQWLVDHPGFPAQQVGPLVDFVAAQRFDGPPIWVARGQQGRAPAPQPRFSMKGRTPASMLRLIAAWHRELAQQPLDLSASWPACDVEGTQLERGGQRWQVLELTTAKDLAAEGAAMHHCVASYVEACTSGQSAIFVVREARRRATVEVRLASKSIVQVRGPYNQMPADDVWAVVESWAARQRLRISDHCRP